MRRALCIPAVPLPQWGMSDILADIAAIIRFYAAFLAVMELDGKAVARLFQFDAFAGRTLVEVRGAAACVRLVPRRPDPLGLTSKRATATLRTGIRISCRGLWCRLHRVRLAMRDDLGSVRCE